MHFGISSDYFRIAEASKSITIKFIILLKTIDEAMILRIRIFRFTTNLSISPIKFASFFWVSALCIDDIEWRRIKLSFLNLTANRYGSNSLHGKNIYLHSPTFADLKLIKLIEIVNDLQFWVGQFLLKNMKIIFQMNVGEYVNVATHWLRSGKPNMSEKNKKRE